jgi:hypothetical protein
VTDIHNGVPQSLLRKAFAQSAAHKVSLILSSDPPLLFKKSALTKIVPIHDRCLKKGGLRRRALFSNPRSTACVELEQPHSGKKCNASSRFIELSGLKFGFADVKAAPTGILDGLSGNGSKAFVKAMG